MYTLSSPAYLMEITSDFVSKSSSLQSQQEATNKSNTISDSKPMHKYKMSTKNTIHEASKY